ncbi:MAG: GFA family protein [Actinomycetota bacterium]
MQTREAACSCGQLRLTAQGDPVRVSICHCLACQRRTGSIFGVQARFPRERVKIEGRYSDFVRLSDWGEERTFHFCTGCGATVFYTTQGNEDLIAVPVGAFADPTFPGPSVSVFESGKHPWVALPDGIEHDDL